MDAIRLLEEQHREVENLFKQIERADQAARLPLLEQLSDLLAVHGELEEKIFYPGVRAEQTEPLLEDSYEDHAEFKTLLALIAETEPESPHFDQTCDRLMNEVRQHIHMEEEELFPLAREVCSYEALETLAGRMVKLDDRLEDLESPSDLAIEEAPLQP